MTEWQVPRELPDLRRVGIIALDTETRERGCRPIAARPGRGAMAMSAASALAWREEGDIRAIYVPLRHPDTDNFDPAQVYRWLEDLIASGVALRHHERCLRLGLAARRWRRRECRPSDHLEEVGALATMVNENLFRYSLDALCAAYGLPGKDEALLRQAVEAAGFAPRRKKINVKNHIWQLPARYVGPYAEADAVNTLALFEKLNPILDQEKTRDAYRLDVDLLPMVLEMRRRGIRIDQDAAEQARDQLLANAMPRSRSFRRSSAPPSAWPRSTAANGRRRPSTQISIDYPRTPKGNPSFSAGKSGWMAKHEHWLPRGSRPRANTTPRAPSLSKGTSSITS